MTDPQQALEAARRYRTELEPALESMIEDEIRARALPNALAMTGTILGAFIVTLVILVLVTGG